MAAPSHDAAPDALAWHARFVEALWAHDAGAYLAFLAPHCEICIKTRWRSTLTRLANARTRTI